MIPDHAAVPVEDARKALRCAVCGGAVRTWPDGRFPIHAEPRPRNVPEPGYPITESELRALNGDR